MFFLEIFCNEPKNVLFSVQSGRARHHLARVRYSCLKGYFVRPGFTIFATQCSINASWYPSPDFTCYRQ